MLAFNQKDHALENNMDIWTSTVLILVLHNLFCTKILMNSRIASIVFLIPMVQPIFSLDQNYRSIDIREKAVTLVFVSSGIWEGKISELHYNF
ncbi:MAG TPA: hypothetical protein VFJ51_04775 [Nitrososphaeraceae archaeon]|nr:hypothetical protein [Nitrososphaeraceae archaeon]